MKKLVIVALLAAMIILGAKVGNAVTAMSEDAQGRGYMGCRSQIVSVERNDS
jgi:hypothetical protein